MNNRAFTISFIIAILAVSMIYSYVSSTETFLAEKYGQEKIVVVAKKPIQELDPLDETNLTTKSMPASFTEPGISSNIKDFQGALAAGPILAGEQITRTKVLQAGVQSGLARQVSIGKRAVTITIGDDTGVAKLIKPGDRVDVLANIDPGSGNKMYFEVRTILQDVLVLATGKYITNTVPGILEVDPFHSNQKQTVRLNEYNNFANVTLEVDPLQAQTVVFAAKNFNGVTLSLRNNDDNSKEDLSRTMAVDLLGGNSARLPAAPQQAPRSGGGGAPNLAPQLPGKR